LDGAIQDLLEDHEYTVDVKKCEEYTDSSKRKLVKANQEIGRRLASSAASELSRSGTAIRPNDSSTSGHSLGDVAPNKTRALCGRCGNVGPVSGTVRVVHKQGP